MTWRAGLEAWAHRQWASRGPVAWLLSPLSLVFLAVSRSRRERTVPNRLPVPVVVVGNIYVGGTGKTPVTIALVRELQARGWRPGVISRGFGRREDGIRLINEETPAAEAGDEPLLIARETGVPVAVGRARFEAGRALLEAHPEVDLIVSDDGLQHAALARDVEIAVVGARGLGNGWVLPASLPPVSTPWTPSFSIHRTKPSSKAGRRASPPRAASAPARSLRPAEPPSSTSLPTGFTPKNSSRSPLPASPLRDASSR